VLLPLIVGALTALVTSAAAVGGSDVTLLVPGEATERLLMVGALNARFFGTGVHWSHHQCWSQVAG
jgi:hypothetical protein